MPAPTAEPDAVPDATGAGLARLAVAVLECADPMHKAALAGDMAVARDAGAGSDIGPARRPPDRPARPLRPELRPPRDMPKRGKAQSRAGRAALLHAVAHIELNAIDLACDIVARFAKAGLPREFFDDWTRVAGDEARHFRLLCGRLSELETRYGDLPAHDGLWEAAEATGHDILARLAVVPLVLEARGLDVTPAMMANLRKAGDTASAEVLGVIYDDEISHVAAGRRWFEHICAGRGLDPVPTYHELVRRHFRGALKPPFNTEARGRAGFSAAYYAPLAGEAT